MFRPTKRPWFTPELFTLEDRSVPSGNVTASLITSKSGFTYLQVNGDSADNHIVLRGNAAGSVTVQGIGTTVNGGNSKLTFTGLHSLAVDVANGDDSVRGYDLAVGHIGISAGDGNDTIRLEGTKGGAFLDGGFALELFVGGDNSNITPNLISGDDTITITGTNVRSQYIYMNVQGDGYETEVGGRDTITISHTNLSIENPEENYWFDWYINGGYGQTAEEPGDRINVNHLTVDAPGTGYRDALFNINGSGGDDRIDVKNVNMTFGSEGYVYFDFGVYAGGGTDTTDFTNVTLVGEMPYGVGQFNQIVTGVTSEVARLTNVSTRAGNFTDDDFGYSGNFFGVVATQAELRNVSVTSQYGAASLYMASSEFDYGGGNIVDDCFTLVNVTVTQTPDFTPLPYPNVFIETGGGNDTVTILNSTMSLEAYLGDGDDKLVLVGNSFIYMAADLGEGDDTAILLFNQADDSISVNGGAGDDTLFAWLNIAPMIVFEEFEN